MIARNFVSQITARVHHLSEAQLSRQSSSVPSHLELSSLGYHVLDALHDAQLVVGDEADEGLHATAVHQQNDLHLRLTRKPHTARLDKQGGGIQCGVNEGLGRVMGRQRDRQSERERERD